MQKHTKEAGSDKNSQPEVKRYVGQDLTRKVGTPRAMPEAQSTWTKRVGAEPNQQNKHSNEVLEPKTEKMAMYT